VRKSELKTLEPQMSQMAQIKNATRILIFICDICG